KVETITRRGKMMIVHLSDGITMLIHLKMTGQLIFVNSNRERYAGGHPNIEMGMEMPVKSTRASMVFEDGSYLYFNDQRKFGYIKIIPTEQLERLPSYAEYGPEPLTPEFTANYLKSRTHSRPKTTINQLLLHQSVVAGIGNIYADESLFMTKIHLSSLAGSLSFTQLELLVENSEKIVLFSI